MISMNTPATTRKGHVPMELRETKILIVDDTPEVISLVRRYLEDSDFRLSVASDGRMAIEKTFAESPDVILLDLVLPDISGQDVLKRIKEITPDTAVIVMTGHGGEDIAVRLMKAGAADYLPKPFDRETLLKSIKWALKIRDSQIEDRKHAGFSSLEKFFPFLAHEIRNPLHAIGGALAIIQRRCDLNDKVLSRSVKIIQEEVKHLSDFVQECLDFVRPLRKSRFLELEMNEVITVAMNIISHMFEGRSREIAVHTDLDPRLPKVYANYEEIKSAFLNILKNGFEAIEETGEITIRTSFNPNAHPGTVEILFTDDGMGIKKENINYLFSPFYTTKVGGTGLGLAICHRIIVERHYGKMQVTSEEGKGTTIKVELPIKPPDEILGD
jgi:signal transduction histidine kinase